MKPVWNPIRREVTLNGAVIKRFRRPAQNQIRLLEAFQEDGWPEFIDDPLPPEGDIAPKHRLRGTVYHLNKNHITKGLIRFHTDGTGQGVLWERLD
jgi:hypothetical protein